MVKLDPYLEGKPYAKYQFLKEMLFVTNNIYKKDSEIKMISS